MYSSTQPKRCAAICSRSAIARRATAPYWWPTTPAAMCSRTSAPAAICRGPGFVDGVQARRQAGSTLKPFLYARALDQRLLTAASLLDDSPLEIDTGNGLFRPRNYDAQFRGLVSVRTALAGSLNVPAVRTLLLVCADVF